MSFFETMLLLELADKQNKQNKPKSEHDGAAEFFLMAVFLYFLFGFPIALYLEFKKKRWQFIVGMLAVYVIDVVIANAAIHDRMWSLIVGNCMFGGEYLLYVGLAWLNRKITGEGNGIPSAKIGVWSYVVLAFGFYIILGIFKVCLEPIFFDKPTLAIVLAAVLGLTGVTVIRAWFYVRANKGKKPVPLYVAILFISSPITSIFWIAPLRIAIDHLYVALH